MNPLHLVTQASQRALTFIIRALINLLIIPYCFVSAANTEKIVFLGNQNIPPVLYMDSDVPSGVCVDIVHALEKHLSHPVEIKAMDWLEAQALVARGEADALIQINETEERKKIYDFSEPLLESKFSIFTRTANVGITGLSGLRGLRVGVESGGLPRQNLEKNPQISLVIIPNFIAGFKQLTNNIIDAVVVDYRVGSYILAQNHIQDIKVTGEPIAFSYSSFAVKKGNTKLLGEINNALRIIKVDGTYNHIIEKWEPKEGIFQTKEQISRNHLHVIILILLITALLSTIWLVVLNKELAKRKAAEEAIRTSESRLRILGDQLPDSFIYEYSAAPGEPPNFHYLSAGVERLWGVKPEDGVRDANLLLGRIDPAMLPEYHAAEATSRRNLSSFNVDVRIQRADGKWRWTHLSSSPRHDADGITIWEGIFTDITERKQIEEALRESESRFRGYVENAPIGVFICDENGRYLEVNPAASAITGYTREELLTLRIPDILPPESQEYPDHSFKEVLATGRTSGEFAFRRKDGHIGMWSLQAVRLSSTRFMGMVTDITEHKQAEDKLKTMTDRFLLAARAGGVGIWDLDTVTNRLTWDDQMYRLYGITADQFSGAYEAWKAGLHPEDLARGDAEIQMALSGKANFDTEFRVLWPDGSTHYIRALAIVQRDASGQPLRMIGTNWDITEHMQAEEERRKLEERMSQVQKLEALGTLVGGVAHNINNVLMVIMGAASLREGHATETKHLEANTLIDKACKRGREVVKSLIKFARPSLPCQVPLELHALISEVRDFLKNTTGDRIEIFEIFAKEPLWIHGDAGSLNHALLNLCLNALDAMPKGGTLTFRTAAPEKDWVEVSVEDSGEGMTPEIQARVLDPFFTTKDLDKGMGLGLSMTYGLVKAHGGTLEISSLPGQGTTVMIRFPRIPAPAQEEIIIEAPASTLRPLNVLLVDDDEDIRFLTARMLKNAGHQIKTVAGGEEALKILGSGLLPDLVILDQNMPRMNGVQTMEKIRALHLDLPILISSGQPDIEEWACFKQPNVAVISKPFEMDELLASLAKMRIL